MTFTNELPVLLPWLNVAFSALTLAVVTWGLYVHRHHELRTIIGGVVLWIAILVLLSGALFQANVLSLEWWIVLGSGGRIAVFVGVLALATQK